MVIPVVRDAKMMIIALSAPQSCFVSDACKPKMKYIVSICLVVHAELLIANANVLAVANIQGHY